MRGVAASWLMMAALCGSGFCSSALCGNALAAVVSQQPDRVTLSIYHLGTVDTRDLAQRGGHEARREGLALVSESRGIDLPAGPVEIQFRGVASTMVPATVQIDGLPGAVKDRNFDFDLLSPGTLIAKSIGQKVHVIRTDPKTGAQTNEPATLASGPRGVVLTFADHVEALGCSGAPERLVFDALPAGLFDTPTLSVHAVVPRAGHYNVSLRYLATGLNWSADYVARVRGATLDLSGWITLANFSETGFAHVPVDVIAGHVATTGNDQPPAVPVTPKAAQCWPTAIDYASYAVFIAARSAFAAAPPPAPAALMAKLEDVVVTGSRINPRDLGDYKLYPLNEPTDVAARQTKQVQFLEARAVPFARVYRAGTDGNLAGLAPDRAVASTILLRLDNSKKSRLGEPLPAGGVSVLTETDGGPLLTGQDKVGDVAVGLPLEIVAGHTMAVRAEARALDNAMMQKGARKFRRTQIEITAVNDKNDAANFEWHQAMDVTGAKLVTQSRAHGTRNGDLVWALALKPGERASFRYTIDLPL